MLGVDAGLEKTAGLVEDDWLRLFDRPRGVDARLRYQRGRQDITGWLPARQHLSCVARGWTAVELEDPVRIKSELAAQRVRRSRNWLRLSSP